MLLKRQGSCQAEPHELAEWIDDTQSIDLSRVLQVLRVEHSAASHNEKAIRSLRDGE